MATNVNGSPGVNGAVPLPCYAGWRARACPPPGATRGQGMGQRRCYHLRSMLGL